MGGVSQNFNSNFGLLLALLPINYTSVGAKVFSGCGSLPNQFYPCGRFPSCRLAEFKADNQFSWAVPFGNAQVFGNQKRELRRSTSCRKGKGD
jgi:hypothetical protein